jgi:hypothetical protein
MFYADPSELALAGHIWDRATTAKPRQPAFIYHGGPRLHQLHRPELRYHRWELSDRSASPDHPLQPSWVGPGPALGQTACADCFHSVPVLHATSLILYAT